MACARVPVLSNLPRRARRAARTSRAGLPPIVTFTGSARRSNLYAGLASVMAVSIMAAVAANRPPKKLSVERSKMRLRVARVLSVSVAVESAAA